MTSDEVKETMWIIYGLISCLLLLLFILAFVLIYFSKKQKRILGAASFPNLSQSASPMQLSDIISNELAPNKIDTDDDSNDSREGFAANEVQNSHNHLGSLNVPPDLEHMMSLEAEKLFDTGFTVEDNGNMLATIGGTKSGESASNPHEPPHSSHTATPFHNV